MHVPGGGSPPPARAQTVQPAANTPTAPPPRACAVRAGGGEKARRRSRRHGTRSGPLSERAGKGLTRDLTGRRFPRVYGAARGGPRLAHARARARHGARGARAREKRWAGPGRGFGRSGANARAQFSGTRPSWSSRLQGSRRRPASALHRERGSLRSRACACAWGQYCPWARTVRAPSSSRLLGRCPGRRLPLCTRRDTQARFLDASGLVPVAEALFMRSRQLQNTCHLRFGVKGAIQSPRKNCSIPKLWIYLTNWHPCVYPGAPLSSHRSPELGFT